MYSSGLESCSGSAKFLGGFREVAHLLESWEPSASTPSTHTTPTRASATVTIPTVTCTASHTTKHTPCHTPTHTTTTTTTGAPTPCHAHILTPTASHTHTGAPTQTSTAGHHHHHLTGAPHLRSSQQGEEVATVQPRFRTDQPASPSSTLP